MNIIEAIKLAKKYPMGWVRRESWGLGENLSTTDPVGYRLDVSYDYFVLYTVDVYGSRIRANRVLKNMLANDHHDCIPESLALKGMLADDWEVYTGKCEDGSLQEMLDTTRVVKDGS